MNHGAAAGAARSDRAGAGLLRRTDAGRRALEAALRGVRGANPLVGAVVLDAHGTVLATGHHGGAGTAHAEAAAIAELERRLDAGEIAPVPGNEPADWSIVVTLEPCNHTGRTGPCSHAIHRAGIGTVVFGAADTTAEAAGGAAWLAARGHTVHAGDAVAPDWAHSCRRLNHRWAAARADGRPFVTLHLAQTLDGRIAAEDGTSQWITGAEARRHSHGVRARADAIVVGTGTVLVDDPRLTARTDDGRATDRQPLRVVMGERDVPAAAAVRGPSEEYLHLRTRDPRRVLRVLADGAGGRTVDHVMVEGGASVATAFLAADLVDEVWLYQAPLLLGAGRGAVGDLGVSTLADGRRFDYDDAGDGAVLRLGGDVALHLVPTSK
ncbi:bifunctional diaminohydroxyphosphoribosylaminopyrimidine deaminase/5-amino-6-(5-phosphoribosylamino)uracil reductase RibD [Zhihengliuella sp.]|uniref:bifunctional diaminohydroxyphosphoribosylaminopyrimidine deaminase/5-amino-6-(5-phosphoribosylamino)uracil reductase RibD n=1 Tax=Zhihengliuella sp. TaxID=1954483 RepID=UPI002811D286|nr:bifunctional diaminohydroxyphosphoribosylaminopyrimidine deaminase/5-amino-6-(5-phosphoribosylamino)uracil reductase RibD [Zhihengliuella sp.]